jgi:small subunit ribosomal protein S1
VQFGAFVQVGDGIEGLVHISEMSAHHVDSPEQVVTPGEELWVKIIDLDLARRRISLSIKQAAEGGELAEEYREHFEVDEHGNWTSGNPDEVEAAWAEYQSTETAETSETSETSEAPTETAGTADVTQVSVADTDDTSSDTSSVTSSGAAVAEAAEPEALAHGDVEPDPVAAPEAVEAAPDEPDAIAPTEAVGAAVEPDA